MIKKQTQVQSPKKDHISIFPWAILFNKRKTVLSRKILHFRGKTHGVCEKRRNRETKKTKKIPLTFSWQARIAPESRDQYNQGIFTKRERVVYPWHGIAANLMETADSTSTLQNSLQPSQPRRKYQEYPVHMLRRAVKFCLGIPSRSGVEISDGNSSGRPPRFFLSFFFLFFSFFSFFFFFSLGVSRVAARFYVSSGFCRFHTVSLHTP